MFFGLNLTDEQEQFRSAIMGNDYDIIFVDALSGTGKTTIAVACAKLLVSKKRFNSLLYSFSCVEEHKLGYTPGTVEDKEVKYLQPLFDALITINENPHRCVSSLASSEHFKNGHVWVDAMSHTFMRGMNISNRVVIIDEAQNLTVPEMRKVLTRCHDCNKVIVIGSSMQSDIDSRLSGFVPYMKHYEDQERAAVITLTKNFRGWISQHADTFGMENKPEDTITE